MASSSPAIVLYAGSAATYVCESGDVQPTYPLLQPITEDLLRHLQSPQPAALSSSHVTERHTRYDATAIREHLFPLLRDRTVFLVLPLACATTYQEEWVRLCFHPEVHVRRLLVLSDTVANAFACGLRGCVVVHASLDVITVSRVEAGASTRYGNSHVGTVQALCGEAATLQLVGQLPRAAAAVATLNAAQNLSGGDDDDDGDDDASAAAMDISVRNAEMAVDLCDAKYRDSLVHAFGYKAYRDVIVMPQQERLNAQTRGSGKGKGKGRGAASSLLNTLRCAYNSDEREAPGQLERLLARVVHGAAAPKEREPCILAGEALAVPHLQQLYAYAIGHCGGGVWEAVERERLAKQRRANAEAATADSNEAALAHERQSSTTALKRRKTDASSSGTNSSSSDSNSDQESSSDDEDSDDDDDDDDGMWLQLQPTPLPTAPWWLPLLGASVVSRLPDQDLQRAMISEDEARESNGTIVHWKTLR